MRFAVKLAGTLTESLKEDRMVELAIGLLIKDTQRNVFYKTVVTVTNEQLIPALEDKRS